MNARLFSESHEEIKSDKKWFEPDDHIVGEAPEELIDEEPCPTYCLKFHIHKYSRQFFQLERCYKQQVDTKK